MCWEFPSEKYDFMSLNEAPLGACETCSPISPAANIERHEDGVNIAGQVMEVLFVEDNCEAKRDAEHD